MITTHRGDIVVLADRAGRYTGKPRPAVVVQSDAFSGTDSLVVCLVTSQRRAAPLLRVSLSPEQGTGLERPSWAQIDKITAIGREQVGQVIGHADDTAMLAISRALAVFLGIA